LTQKYGSILEEKKSIVELEGHSGGVCFQLFVIFFISFQEIQKLDDPKSEKLTEPFHELLSFSLLDLPKANPKK
jgi:hypothetical protein